MAHFGVINIHFAHNCQFFSSLMQKSLISMMFLLLQLFSSLFFFCSLPFFNICFLCFSCCFVGCNCRLTSSKHFVQRLVFLSFGMNPFAHDVVPSCVSAVPNFLKAHMMTISLPKKSQSWLPTSFLPGMLDLPSCSDCSFADLTCCEQVMCHVFLLQLTGLPKCDMQRHVHVENQHSVSFQVEKNCTVHRFSECIINKKPSVTGQMLSSCS